MTIYCPSCGAPNTDQAAQCVKCSGQLKGRGGSKFKGTMIMTGAAAPTPPGAPGSPPSGATPQATPGQATPGQATPDQPAAANQDPMAFQRTMMGPVVPPGTAGAPTPGAAATTPQQAPAQQPPAQQPPAQQPPAQQPPAAASAENAQSPATAPGHPAQPAAGHAMQSGSAGGGLGSGAGAATMGAGAGLSAPPAGGRGGGNRIWWILGLGCLGIILLSCLGFGAMMFLGAKAVDEQFDGGLGKVMEEAVPRAHINGFLQQALNACSKGDEEAAAELIHPDQREALKGRLCELDMQTIQELTQPMESELVMGGAAAEALGFDSEQCYSLVSLRGTVSACLVGEAEGGTPAMQLIELDLDE